MPVCFRTQLNCRILPCYIASYLVLQDNARGMHTFCQLDRSGRSTPNARSQTQRHCIVL